MGHGDKKLKNTPIERGSPLLYSVDQYFMVLKLILTQKSALNTALVWSWSMGEYLFRSLLFLCS